MTARQSEDARLVPELDRDAEAATQTRRAYLPQALRHLVHIDAVQALAAAEWSG